MALVIIPEFDRMSFFAAPLGIPDLSLSPFQKALVYILGTPAVFFPAAPPGKASVSVGKMIIFKKGPQKQQKENEGC